MRSKFFKILVFICVMVVIAIIFALKQYNKPHENIRTSKPEMLISAGNLIKEFRKDEITATKLYTDKIIQVTGIVSEVKLMNGNSIVTILGEDSQSSTICHMLTEENLNTLKLQKGQSVTIKGKCSGFLLDVIMIRCVLINGKNE